MTEVEIYSAISDLKAYRTMFDNTAGNIAHVNTEPYHPLGTVREEAAGGGVMATTVREPVVDRVDLSPQAMDLMVAEFASRSMHGS